MARYSHFAPDRRIHCESLANALFFLLTRYVSEGDEAAAASGSDDDDDAEEEEVVEEEDAAPGKYKSTPPYARRERVTLLDICIV
jgi:hypothetical protein